ncbi:ras GTPase-activating protein-binding protein 2 isoform X2 [Maniola hyperantus]|uniref:ras GTPase-activating protein-binding protein 2 isoform X2 n=1 Tax=Aphantopus hyperantus TaxID=2795564 RepID=UPI003749BA83
MVMEASPSPQSVGREFVRQYYTLLNKAPAHLHRFYNNYSSFVHGGLDAPNRETLPVIGQKQIHNRIQQLNFRDCHAKISQVDAQATLGNGVVVQVTGELSNGGAPMRRFTQTFVLAAQSPKKYYVHNDIFRYQDIVFSDEEGEGSGRSEGEEEEGVSAAGGGFFPPAPSFPAPFPAPPAPPHAPLLSPPAPPAAPVRAASPPAPPHLNGHPPQHDDATRHLVTALQGTGAATPAAGANTSVSSVELEEAAPEPEPEPEPEREPSPPPQPTTPVAPEPKTYANLLKSGSSNGAGAPRGSPPAQPAPPAPVPAPAPVSHEPREPRPRPPRNPQPQQQVSNPSESGRRYSDAQQLFLGNLPHSATEDELRALFARFGTVAELRVHSKPAAPGAPRHPNYGFITYESPQAAADCLNAAPLYFPAEAGEGAGVKLNVEEKKTRGREPPRRRPLSSHRAAFQPRQPYRR